MKINIYDNEHSVTQDLQLLDNGKALKRLIYQRPLWGTDTTPRQVISSKIRVPERIATTLWPTTEKLTKRQEEADALRKRIEGGFRPKPIIAFFDGHSLYSATGHLNIYAGMRGHSGVFLDVIAFDGTQEDACKYFELLNNQED